MLLVPYTEQHRYKGEIIMYVVLEIQKLSESQLATIVTTHESWDVANQQYHTALAAAAVSGLPRHSAMLINEDGGTLKAETYPQAQEGAV